TAGPAVARQPEIAPSTQPPAIVRVSETAASTVAFVPHDPAFRAIRRVRVRRAPVQRHPGATGGTVVGGLAPTAAPTPTSTPAPAPRPTPAPPTVTVTP